jgi:hypothetical protein
VLASTRTSLAGAAPMLLALGAMSCRRDEPMPPSPSTSASAPLPATAAAPVKRAFSVTGPAPDDGSAPSFVPSTAHPASSEKPVAWHARKAGLRTVQNDPWTIVWTSDLGTARAPGTGPWTLFERSADDPGCEREFSGRVLSVVGTVVSSFVSNSEFCAHAAHPSEDRTFTAVDVAKVMKKESDPKSSLFEWFERRQVVHALATDPYLAKFRAAPSLSDEDAIEALRESQCEFTTDGYETAWAVYDAQGDQVSVRIGLPYGCGAARGRITQIGLVLTPSPDFRAKVQAAQRDGLLMSRLAADFRPMDE